MSSPVHGTGVGPEDGTGVTNSQVSHVELFTYLGCPASTGRFQRHQVGGTLRFRFEAKDLSPVLLTSYFGMRPMRDYIFDTTALSNFASTGRLDLLDTRYRGVAFTTVEVNSEVPLSGTLGILIALARHNDVFFTTETQRSQSCFPFLSNRETAIG